MSPHNQHPPAPCHPQPTRSTQSTKAGEPAPHPEAGGDSIHNRTALIVGKEGLCRLQSATVAVFGLGAVGSFAVEALTRSSIGNLVLIDFDTIKKSNLNRQLFALQSTVGMAKVEAAALRVLQINPDINLVTKPAFFTPERAAELLDGRFDHIIDAIDSLNPKVHLIKGAVERQIPIISAMGAANRTDPTQIRITDISRTEGCPLARKVRRRLKRHGIYKGVTTVWSAEIPRYPSVSPDDPRAAQEHDPAWRGRTRGILPSMAPLPGIFGLAAANQVIWDILNGPEPIKPHQ